MNSNVRVVSYLRLVKPRRGGRRRRRVEFAFFAPPRVDPDAWVDALTDDEFGEILGPSWAALTGRNIDHLIPDHSEGAA